MLALGSAKAAGQTGLTIGSHFGFVFVLILAIIGLIVAFQVKKPQASRDL